jgi:hypothetical protein
MGVVDVYKLGWSKGAWRQQDWRRRDRLREIWNIINKAQRGATHIQRIYK